MFRCIRLLSFSPLVSSVCFEKVKHLNHVISCVFVLTNGSPSVNHLVEFEMGKL